MNMHYFSFVPTHANIKIPACVICLFLAACGNSGIGRHDASLPATTADTTIVVAARDCMTEMRELSASILENFPYWTIDSTGCESIANGVARFKIRGYVTEKIAARTMRVQPDSVAKNALSYIILHEMEKGKFSTFDALCIPEAGTAVICPSERTGQEDDIDLILVSKRDHRLRALDYDSGLLLNVPAATGRNPGNKKRYGDKKTPEGIFSIYAIHDASGWDYDFHDGKGTVKGCYGKYFVRFREYYHIGIHGTHLPETVGSRATEACIRLCNEDIERIVPMISVSETLIAVTPAYEDVIIR
jgi:hypothetical protein